MKTLLFSLLCILGCSMLNAQSQTIEQLAAATSDMDDRSSFNLSGSWLQSFFKSEENDFRTHLTNLQLLSLPEEANVSFSDLSRDLYNEGFEVLTETRSGGKRTEIMIKETSAGITDLVLLTKGEENLTAISLSGLIVIDELDDMDVNIDGWDGFNRSSRD